VSKRKRVAAVEILRDRRRICRQTVLLLQERSVSMNTGWIWASVAAIVASGYVMEDPGATGGSGPTWRDHFEVNKADLLPTGKNAYIPMQPGRVLHLRHGDDTLTVTILPDTQVVDGVTTGVLEERETKHGKLVEVSRNLLATDQRTGDVYYFGEDVDNYKDGKIVNHESEWRAGVGGARFGLMIPAAPAIGQAFYQEIAPKVATRSCQSTKPSRHLPGRSNARSTSAKPLHSSGT